MAKYLIIWNKMYKILKYSEKEQVIACDYRKQQTATKGPDRDVARKQSTANFPEKKHFLPPDTHTHVPTNDQRLIQPRMNTKNENKILSVT